MSKKHLYS